MLGTGLFFKTLHVSSAQWSLYFFFLVIFVKKKKTFYLFYYFFVLICCGCFMHFIFVQLSALVLTVNKKEPYTCLSNFI